MPVSIDTYTPQILPKVSIDTQQDSQVPLDSELARMRAFKTAYGIKDVTPHPEEEVYSQMVSGYENIMRSQVATEQDGVNAQKNYDLLTQAASDPEMTAERLKGYVDNLPPTRPINPETVFEKSFADAVVKNAEDSIQKNYKPDERLDLAEAFKYVKPGTSDLISKQQYLKNWAQNIYTDSVQKQSWVGYGADFVKNMVQPYAETKQRGNVPGVGFFEGPLGYNLKQQGTEVLRKDMQGMINTLKPYITKLQNDNPQLAVQYLNALAGTTGEEQVVNNLMTFAMPLDWVGLGSAGKQVFRKGGPVSIVKIDTMTGKEIGSTVVNTLQKGVHYTPDELEGLGIFVPAPTQGKKAPLTYTADELEALGVYHPRVRVKAGSQKVYTPDELEGLGVTDVRNRVANTAKDLVRSSAEDPVTPSSIASATGDIEGSAVKKISEIFDKRLKGDLDPNSEIRTDADLVTSNYRIDRADLSNNTGSRGMDLANRVLQALDRHVDSVLDAISNRVNIDQFPGLFKSEAQMARLTKRLMESGEYKGLSSSIADIEYKHDILSNTMSYNLVLRQAEGLPFASEKEARAWALHLNKLPEKDVKVVPDGLMGYKVLLNKPLKANDSVLQDLLIPTAHEVEPEGLLRSYIGWALNPDETLSEAHREARKIAAYGPSWLMEHMKADAQMLKSLSRGATQVNPITGKTEVRQLSGARERFRDWDRMIKAMRTMPDPDDPTAPLGLWHKSVGDMEDYYYWHYKRMPEEAEVQAYFAYKRISEYDRILRDLRYYGNMWREGVQNQKFSFKDKEGATKDLTFRGHEIDHLPRTDGKMLVIDDKENIKSFRKYNAARLGGKEKDLQKHLDEGTGRIYRVWNPDEHEFWGVGPVTEDDWVRYVFVKGGAESSNIPFNLLPRRGGGHWDVDHPFYMVQGRIHYDTNTTTGKDKTDFNAVYAGKRTVMPIQIRAEGEKAAGHINEVRKLLKLNDDAGAEAYYAAHVNEVGIPWKKLRTWFNSTVDEQGRKVKPMLNLDHDLRIIAKDEDLINIDKSIERFYTEKNIPFVDGTKTGNPAKQAQVQYTGMRDSDELWTVKDRGTKNNPLFEYETAKLADPIETMNRALTKITQSTYLEDYKQFAVSHWLKTASNWLQDLDKDIAGAPYHYFYDPKWKANAPEDVKRRLMAQNNNIRQFLGMANPTDRLVRETEQKLVDQIYGKYGPNAVKFIPDWMMFGTNDPVSFIKKVTYHAALGLFSIPQFAVQIQSFALIAALAPKSVLAGTFGTLLHNWARINPKMIETLDKYATKLNLPGIHGFKPGEFAEAYKLGNETGFFNVQGEHAFIDSIMNGHKLVEGMGTTFLQWGTAPFREGERQVRLGAWYSAFKEFRAANPIGRITRQDAAKILNRADDLYGNMSRASSSSLHSGILSIPTQFLSYQIRIAELFMGSRTSGIEKARMFATYSALYGVPMATGLSALPLGDYLKRQATDQGYNAGDNLLLTLAMEGIPATFLALATGGGDMKKGKFFNIGERYASTGMDIFRGDKNMWDIIGGPAYSKTKGVLEGMSPFWQTMMSMFRDDDQSFPLTAQDYLRPWKEISSVSNVDFVLRALNTQRIFTKKGIYMDDTSPGAAIFMGLTGLRTLKSTDAQRMSITLKEREHFKDENVKEFELRFKQGIRLAAAGQQDEAKDFFKQAMVYLHQSGAREDELTAIFARASKDNESLADSIQWQYYVKQVPPALKAQMYDAYSRRLQTPNNQ